MASDKPQIRVTEDQRDHLHSLKRPGESYADVLDRVLDTENSEKNV
jgi:predicted CopG family antitoxin